MAIFNRDWSRGKLEFIQKVITKWKHNLEGYLEPQIFADECIIIYTYPDRKGNQTNEKILS